MIDSTHANTRGSWVPSANDHPEFPVQNLPMGVFAPPDAEPRGGIAIGDMILDLRACLDAGLFTGDAARAAEAASGPELNPYLAQDGAARIALRQRVADILDANGAERGRIEPMRAHILRLADDCEMCLPASVGDYTDFYAGIHHATNTGRLLRSDAPLMPNYRHMPIAYHGRASSVRPSGGEVVRPWGQTKGRNQDEPVFAPSRRLDYELELGVWIGPGNRTGEPIPIAQAAGHVAGFCLLNDWSARDIQGWEYQPLGPFLAKSFTTSVSPWMVTTEALAPFRSPQTPNEPRPLDYLMDRADQDCGALDIEMQVLLLTERMRERGLPPHRLCRTNARNLYWTAAQMVAHHTSNGCNLRPGDLFGSGTISGPNEEAVGSLLERTSGGRTPVDIGGGETRAFLEDGDEVIFRAHCRRDGFVPIGFGECRAKVGKALPGV